MATSLVIKYSVANSAPSEGSLYAGEQAYSFVSDVLFIGHPDGSVQNTGGYYYTQIIDSITSQSITNKKVPLYEANRFFEIRLKYTQQ